MKQGSGVGVLDKAVVVIDAVAARPLSLAELVEVSSLPRPTAYRLAVALETHGILGRDTGGRFMLGARLGEWAATVERDPLDAAAGAVLERLRDTTHESAQLYRRAGSVRRCVAAAEPSSGLRDTVPVGAELPMSAGSAAQVLLAWSDGEEPPSDARFSTSGLAAVRRRGWASSVAERESGVASVSAPVFDAAGRVVAAMSVSGPIERLTRTPGKLHAEAVVRASQALSSALGHGGGGSAKLSTSQQ